MFSNSNKIEQNTAGNVLMFYSISIKFNGNDGFASSEHPSVGTYIIIS